MQLILLLLMLLSGTQSLPDIKPLLSGAVGDGSSDLLNEAEQLARIASAFSPRREEKPAESAGGRVSHDADAFPLEPVSNIADEGITYSLSRYFAAGR